MAMGWKNDRLFPSGQFPAPLSVLYHDGILAQVAHYPGQLVPGLCVHSPGRQPAGKGQDVPESADRMVPDGHMHATAGIS